MAARRVALLCAALTLAIGLATLAGWASGVRGISRLDPSGLSMKPNTALLLVLMGAALVGHLRLGRTRRAAPWLRACGLLAATLAAVIGSQWLTGVDLGLDQLLFADPHGWPAPGRTAPVPAIGLVALGLAMELDRRRGVDGRIVNIIALGPLLYGLFALAGYASGIEAFTGVSGALRASLATALGLICASGSLLLARPERGTTRLLVSTRPGGLVVRRLLPAVILVPLALNLTRFEATRTGLLEERTGDWLFVFLVLISFSVVVLRLARGLDLADVGRAEAEDRLRFSEERARSVTESANDAIVTTGANGWITTFNPAAERLFGWSAAELVGRPMTILVPERHRAGLALALGNTGPGRTGATVELHGLTRDGREFDLELSLAHHGGAGGVHHTAIMRDISDRKALEDLGRQESERMAAVVAAQTAIAAGGGELADTMDTVAARACAVAGGDGAVIELPDGGELVYRAAVGSAASHLGLRVPIEGSLAGLALRTALTLHCADTETDPRVDRDACRHIGARSMLCVPLRHRGEAVGVLKVTSRAAQAFSARDEAALELVAGLAASTLHRAQAERRVAALHAVGAALADAGSLEEAMGGAVQELGERLGWDLGAVWLEEPLGTVRCVESWHAPALAAAPYLELTAATAPADAGVLGAVRRTATAVWVEQADEAPGSSMDPERIGAVAASGVRTLVAVPIVSRGETLGVLELGCRDARTHEAAAVELLTAIATQIGQCVQRRRAEERVALHAANLAAVADLSQALSRVTDPHAARPMLCTGIRDVTRSDQVTLLESDGAGRLVVTAQSGDSLPLGFTVDLEAEHTVTGRVFRSGERRFVADLMADADARHALTDELAIRSAHFEPIVRDGKVRGVLVVASRQVRAADADGADALVRLAAAEAAGAMALADHVLELAQRARTDQLTGLANRRAWDEELPKELARAARTDGPVTVAVIDLDHFKAYNDTYGHPAGDRLLRAAASAWTARVRTTDLLARYGGEEFAVVLPGCDGDAAALVADALREAVPGGQTCSIGLATWDGDETPEALVARADAALYRAKGAGRDRVVAA